MLFGVLASLAALVAAWNDADGGARPDDAASEPVVAVFVEEGMVNYGGIQTLPPERIAGLLEEYGLEAENLDAEALADPSRLDPRRYPVLIMPYGNAFPLEALDALLAYRKAGGACILTGVPFCHPCEKRDGKWIDLGGSEHLRHDGENLGTGGFAGPADGVVTLAAGDTYANPLRFPAGFAAPPPASARQWLRTDSLSPDDEVIPLVVLTPAGASEGHPLAAIIRHRCDEYPGALDVWMGQAAVDISDEHHGLAVQMMVRGVAWCLREKGHLGVGGFEAIVDRLDRMPPPDPLPSNLAVPDWPRPWGDTFLPKSPPPARTLLVVDTAPLSEPERIALACLQGLTSRTRPTIWLDVPWQRHGWLEWHVEKGYIDDFEKVADWTELFRRFQSAYNGAVIADTDLYGGPLIAANVAACEDLILATPELAERLEIPVVEDLRGRFSTYAEGMRWVWETYKDRLNRHLCDFLHPSRLANGAFAYDLQWRAPLFWIVGPKDAVEPGADMLAEKRLMAEIFAEMAPNTAVLGFPFHGEGVGPGEVNGVAFAGRYGHPLVCTDSLVNVPVTSGVVIDRLEQRDAGPPPPLEHDKIYIALAMSDGDNQNTWVNGFFKGYMEHPGYGRFPLSFGMGPPIIDLMPGVVQWYFEHAAPGTEFIADVSGIGYMQPANYGLAYADRDAVFDGFLDWTDRYLRRLDMGTLRTVEGEDALLRRYARLGFLHSLFADMGRYSGREGIDNLTYTLPEGMPVFRSVTSWRYGKEGFLREVREQVGDVRPAFVNGFTHCWTFRMDDIVRIYEERDPDMVFVSPSQLAALYRQFREKGN